MAQSIDILRQVAESAAKSEITLVLEVVNRYKSNVLNTAAQGVDMCRRIGAPNVKVHLDVYHMNIEVGHPVRHRADGQRSRLYPHRRFASRLPGIGQYRPCGRVPRPGTARRRRTITFESFSSRVVGQPLEGILGIWRNLWEDGHDLAAHALMYTKAQLKAAQEAHRQATERSRLPLPPA